MRTVATVADVRAILRSAKAPIGFVPTMGFLHEGHLSLIRRCREECATVVVSIFVNPTQFGPHEDLNTYPRDLPRDLRLCEADGVDLVFCPAVEEMYPAGHATFVDVDRLGAGLEGESRPGHFRGVATVVAKLLGAVRPSRAYFGEKDYQQLQVVRRLAQDLVLLVDIIGCPIVRETDGLALSSRNVYLRGEDRRRALALFAALEDARAEVAKGQRNGEALSRLMRDTLTAVDGVEVDYAVVVDPETLEPAHTLLGEARALVAARVGGVRLIDNAALVPATQEGVPGPP